MGFQPFLRLPALGDEAINVKDRGVVADGTTDQTATLQGIVDGLDPNKRHTLFFPEGEYIVYGLRLDGTGTARKNIALVGCGPSTILQTKNNAPPGSSPNRPNIIEIRRGEQFRIESLVIRSTWERGDSTAPSSDGMTDDAYDETFDFNHGIYVNGLVGGDPVRDVVIRNVEVTNTMYAGICAGSGPTRNENAGPGVEDIQILGCTISRCSTGVGGLNRKRAIISGNRVSRFRHTGINVDDGGVSNAITGNVVRGVDSGAPGAPAENGISSYCGTNLTISGNAIDNALHGIKLILDNDEDASGAAVTGNVISGALRHGVLLLEAPNVTVSGNRITTDPSVNATGVRVDTSDSAVVDGNTIFHTRRQGVYVTNSKAVAVTGNTIRRNSTPGAAGSDQDDTRAGILMQESTRPFDTSTTLRPAGERCTFSDNTIVGEHNGIHVIEADSVRVAGNVIVEPVASGIRLHDGYGFSVDGNVIKLAGSHGMELTSVRKSVVSDNVVSESNTLNQTTDSAGIALTNACTEVLITGNRAFDARPSTSQYQEWGLYLAHGQVDVGVLANHFKGNDSGDIGFGQSGGGTSSAPGGATPVALQVSASTQLKTFAHLLPGLNGSLDLGTSTARWRDIYTVNPVTTTSDGRLKEDIDDSPLGLAFVESLRPRQFRRIGEESRELHHGFVAQEVEDAIGGAGSDGIVVSDDDRYGLRETELLAPLVAAVQELSARLAEVERR